MSVRDVVRFAAGALTGHGLRTALCLVGVAVGVASVILLTALGEGARRYVTGEFETLGSDLVIVMRGRTETAGAAPIVGGAPHDLTLADAEAIRRELRTMRIVTPLAMGTATLSANGRSRDVPVVGTTAEFLPLRRLTMGAGRFLPEGDWHAGERLAVIGQTVQRELFGESNPLGRLIRIDDWRFRVIGVMGHRGESVGMNLDDLAFVPVTTGLRIFNRSSLFRILLRSRSHAEINTTRDEVRTLLTRRHSGDEDITVVTQDAVVSSFDRILAVLTMALGGIATVSLAVAGIGVMNVMLVSVSERTSEVGLLMAVGGLRRQVLAVFLAEATLLTVSGGACGLALGLGLVRATRALYPTLPATPPGWAIGAVILLAALVGVLAGVIPARRAASMDPVVALSQRRGN
ncbi:MAG: ABC transporter permease [Acidobacteriota bacterium]